MSQLYDLMCENCGKSFIGHRNNLHFPLCDDCANLVIKVKYRDSDIPKLKIFNKENWIDLYVSDIIFINEQPLPKFRGITTSHKIDGWEICEGDCLHLNLGVSITLPDDYEVLLTLKSHTFLKYGIIQVDEINYNPEKDSVWTIPVYCIKKGVIPKHAAIAQFRWIKKQVLTDKQIIEERND